MKRVAVLRDPAIAAGIGQFAAIQALAPPPPRWSPIDVRDDVGEIDRAITAFASERNGGLIVTASAQALIHRDLIISLATRHSLPNVHAFRYYPASGGLASYGPNPIDTFSSAAAYVDRILKGREACRSPGAGADQLRADHQTQGRQSARTRHPVDAAQASR